MAIRVSGETLDCLQVGQVCWSESSRAVRIPEGGTKCVSAHLWFECECECVCGSQSSQKLFPQQGMTTASLSISLQIKQRSSLGTGSSSFDTGGSWGTNGGFSFLPTAYALLQSGKRSPNSKRARRLRQPSAKALGSTAENEVDFTGVLTANAGPSCR